jgi:glutamate N-acetyltransferase/amino-acid N-acetyltransferase
MENYKLIQDQGPETVAGFRAGGSTCGLKASGKPDLGLLWSESPAQAFGAFTRNKVVAAPVIVSREILEAAPRFHGVVVNSGNANACTGDAGFADARAMSNAASRALGVPEGTMLVCSTGVIGKKLDIAKVEAGLPTLAAQLRDGTAPTSFNDAILTTDTRRKVWGAEIPAGGKTIRIGGCCKGSGMIHPDMATMLAFIATDLQLPASFDQEFRAIIDDSFNSITVDGDTSTNDTALLFANEASGLKYEELTLSEQGAFRQALFGVFAELAKDIVRDGEGATKFVELRIRNAASRKQARKIGRFIGNSKLVKTALFGADPNWGRLLSSLGASGEEVDPARVTIAFEGVDIFRTGEPCNPPKEQLLEIVKRPEYVIHFDLDQGTAGTSVWTCDLSYEYVRINAEYTT